MVVQVGIGSMGKWCLVYANTTIKAEGSSSGTADSEAQTTVMRYLGLHTNLTKDTITFSLATRVHRRKKKVSEEGASSSPSASSASAIPGLSEIRSGRTDIQKLKIVIPAEMDDDDDGEDDSENSNAYEDELRFLPFVTIPRKSVRKFTIVAKGGLQAFPPSVKDEDLPALGSETSKEVVTVDEEELPPTWRRHHARCCLSAVARPFLNLNRGGDEGPPAVAAAVVPERVQHWHHQIQRTLLRVYLLRNRAIWFPPPPKPENSETENSSGSEPIAAGHSTPTGNNNTNTRGDEEDGATPAPLTNQEKQILMEEQQSAKLERELKATEIQQEIGAFVYRECRVAICRMLAANVDTYSKKELKLLKKNNKQKSSNTSSSSPIEDADQDGASLAVKAFETLCRELSKTYLGTLDEGSSGSNTTSFAAISVEERTGLLDLQRDEDIAQSRSTRRRNSPTSLRIQRIRDLFYSIFILSVLFGSLIAVMGGVLLGASISVLAPGSADKLVGSFNDTALGPSLLAPGLVVITLGVLLATTATRVGIAAPTARKICVALEVVYLFAIIAGLYFTGKYIDENRKENGSAVNSDGLTVRQFFSDAAQNGTADSPICIYQSSLDCSGYDRVCDDSSIDFFRATYNRSTVARTIVDHYDTYCPTFCGGNSINFFCGPAYENRINTIHREGLIFLLLPFPFLVMYELGLIYLWKKFYAKIRRDAILQRQREEQEARRERFRAAAREQRSADDDDDGDDDDNGTTGGGGVEGSDAAQPPQQRQEEQASQESSAFGHYEFPRNTGGNAEHGDSSEPTE